MRVAAAFVLSVAFALCACSARRHDAAANTAALHACETRQMQLAGVDTTVVANADASLAEVDLSGGSATGRRSAMQEAYKAFGKPHADSNVHSVQSKWGLTTWADRCGRTVPPHSGSATTR